MALKLFHLPMAMTFLSLLCIDSSLAKWLVLAKKTREKLMQVEFKVLHIGACHLLLLLEAWATV